MTGRIRWEDAQRLSSRPGTIAGYTGTLARPAFMLYGPERTARDWLLTVRLAPETEFIPGAGPGDLKAEAERWLVEFVSSLGAVFPDTRQMAADAIALSKEHADRAAAAEARWSALKDHLTARAAAFDARAGEFRDGSTSATWFQTIADENKVTLAKMSELESGEQRAEDKGRHPAAVIVRCDELREGDRLLESDAMVTVLRVDTYDDHLGISVWAEEGRRWYLDRQPSSLVAVCRTAGEERTGDGEPRHA